MREPSWRNKRIDARVQNDPATQAGVRGAHRDMRGNVIGGYTRDGQAFGTKLQQNQIGGGSGLDQQAAPVLPAVTPMSTAGQMPPPAAAMPPAPFSATPEPLGGAGNPATPGLSRWKAMNPNAPSGQEAIDASRGPAYQQQKRRAAWRQDRVSSQPTPSQQARPFIA
jgi:hypothetical protein